MKATDAVEDQQDDLPNLLKDICHGIEENSKEEDPIVKKEEYKYNEYYKDYKEPSSESNGGMARLSL